MNDIILEYHLINGEHKKRMLSIEEYFDLEENEIPSIDSVPQYDQPYKYLLEDIDKIALLNLTIDIGGEQLMFKQAFWNEGKNFVTESSGSGKRNYRELILTTYINQEKGYEVIRIAFWDKNIYPIFHSFIATNSDGSENETKVPLNYTKNMFWDKFNKALG